MSGVGLFVNAEVGELKGGEDLGWCQGGGAGRPLDVVGGGSAIVEEYPLVMCVLEDRLVVLEAERVDVEKLRVGGEEDVDEVFEGIGEGGEVVDCL